MIKEETALADEKIMLSPENLQKLGKVIDEAKGLMSQQLEILEKVLKAEEDIASVRIGHLEQFFDVYSAGLNAVAKRQSQLGETYLVLNNKADKFISNSPSGGGGGGSSGGGDSNDIADRRPSGKDAKASNMDRDDLDEVTISGVSEEAIKSGEEKRAAALKRLHELALHYQQNEEEQAMAFDDYLATLEEQRAAKRTKLYDSFAEKQKTIEESLIELQNLRTEDGIDQENRILSIRLKNQQSVLDAEIAAQNYINNLSAEMAYAANPEFQDEAFENQQRKKDAEYDLGKAKKFNEAVEKERAKLQLAYAKKNNGVLRKEDFKAIEEQLRKKYKDSLKNEKNLSKERERLNAIESEKANAAERDELRQGVGALTKSGASFNERKQALYELTHDEAGNTDKGKAISAAILAVSDLAKQLEAKIDMIAGFKGAVDTRMQGSNSEKFMGSYWDQLVRDMTSVGAINPFFKQETFANNIKDLVNRGISFDLKQRAFLMTISDKIATTFNVADGTLLRLIRIQQQDSTAGRLGMESALNSFLNEMYETSEYLTDVAASVRGSLEEMQALMEGAAATEVEYQVQKWLGSLYSVGMSQSATQGIADALGKIAAGQIEGLTNGGAGNLLIMAANDAGLSIADILTDGINSSDTNKLLQAAVNYLAELSDSAADNKVVQQQLADVFGVRASDLRAATNLVLPGSTKSIYGNSMTYGNMLSQLSSMAGSMASRTSVAEMMTNFWENGQYTLAGSMASNPVSYFIYKMAKVVDDAAGGIDLPFLNVMGFGVDLNTTVSDLMRVAAVGGGILGSLGPLVSGLGSSFSGRAMLNKLGIGSGSGLNVVQRGDGGGSSGSQGGGSQSTSGSGYAGNSSGSDVKDSTIQESEDSKKKQMIEAKEEEEANKVDVLNQTVIKIYELLEEVASGKSSFSVKVEGYGLTKAGGGGSSALGGVAGLGNAGASSGFGGGLTGSSSGGGNGVSNSGSVSGNVTFGGWNTL